jgi:putative inorganic carbon (HCO3(-)) transporter
VFVLAALSGPAPKAGAVAAALLVAVVLVHPRARWRQAAMLAALVLAPTLLVADIWHSPQLGVVHRHPLTAVAAGLAGVALVAAVALLIARRPWLIAPLALAALPFRIPIEAGGQTANLLVPLYLVVGAGCLAAAAPGWRAGSHGAAEVRRAAESGRPAESGRAAESRAAAGGAERVRHGVPLVSWVQRLLATYVLLYALQSIYSPDFEKALQQLVFFYVPFALLFCVLREVRFTPALLRGCLGLVAALAVVFACIGFVEYATKTLLLNPKLVAANTVHTYFTVNSVFFDPDIFGRFLALVMISVAAGMLYARRQREQLTAVAVLAVLWAGLVLTLSRSSLGVLLVGLGVLGAMRWRVGPILLAGTVVAVLGLAALAISPKTFGLNQGLNGASSGRAGLVSGGLKLFERRPLWGNGSGSFVTRYRQLHPGSTQALAASHTIAITIAAEQGLIGVVPYLALVVAACAMLARGARRDAPRAAIAAAFIALVVHTQLYADFLEDPATWTLLAIGTALALARRHQTVPDRPIADAAAVPA